MGLVSVLARERWDWFQCWPGNDGIGFSVGQGMMGLVSVSTSSFQCRVHCQMTGSVSVSTSSFQCHVHCQMTGSVSVSCALSNDGIGFSVVCIVK